MSLITNCLRIINSSIMSNEKKVKGYKVTNVDRTRKFGIACRNLQEFKRKACLKFNVSNDEAKNVLVYLLDGSEIDDEYFLTVEPQTTFIICKRGERILSDADIFYNTLRKVNLEYITAGDAVSKFLSENLKNKIAVLNKAVNENDSKTILSSRDDHPEWFENLETSAKSKEAYMHRRCQDRIRGYLYKTIEQIKSCEEYTVGEKSRCHLTNAIKYFKLQLREDHYMGFYFDRSRARNVDDGSEILNPESNSEFLDEADATLFRCYDHCPCRIRAGDDSELRDVNRFNEKFFTSEVNDREEAARRCETGDELDARKISPSKKARTSSDKDPSPYELDPPAIGVDRGFSLCDRNGKFKCEGVWNSERCSYGDRHSINPYRSYEELVIFSTWNFDHRIERSRTLIPNLIIEASKEDGISKKKIRYFYDNIFTIKNLRLVHIICHDKGAHNNE